MDRISQHSDRRASQATLSRRLACLITSAATGALLFSACSGGSSGDTDPSAGPGNSTFAVVGTSIIDGAEWKLNREITIQFNQDVDFSTVSLSTVQIVNNQGVPAVGTFSLSQNSSRIVTFQPRCPTNDTNSNGGLLQGGSYRLTLPSENSPGLGNGVTVQNTAGQRLRTGLNVGFTTPTSNDPLVLFVDVEPGPPQVIIRDPLGIDPEDPNGSYVEFEGDPDNRSFFSFGDPDGAGPEPPQGFIPELVPLNRYSRISDQFAIVLRFNQPVFAASSNISTSLIGLEYDSGGNVWEPVPSTVALTNNCTATGAEVRLTPRGIVPQGSRIRVALRAGFQDLTGDSVQSTQVNFARMVSNVANPDAVGPARGDGSDEILESFMVGGAIPGSLEDTAAASGLPRANWAGDLSPDALSGAFDFPGTGGPSGTFDVVVRAGDTVVINTDADTITGGPDGSNSTTVPIINGVLDVNDFTVEPMGRVIFLGSNTGTILATGNVVIRGLVTLNGGDNLGVGTLDTTDQPEEGAAGQAGGGAGGTGSFLTSQSTPRGGTGNGPFDVPGLGGQGGETGFAPGGSNAKENRRGGGGGGGRFGEDIRYEFASPSGGTRLYPCQTTVGMDAEPGFLGSLDGTGAVSQATFQMGGDLSPFPFLDASDENNFFGTMFTADNEQIIGELPSTWAGVGGGAGGDAVRSPTFPLTPFDPQGDEKGSGGGGGAGGLLILAIGNIEVRGDGQITADGGNGGGGENVIFFDRIGGGGGGGSGGHIVMSTASAIIIDSEATAAATADFYLDDPDLPVHEKRPVRALGGQGGVGRLNRCGANETGQSQWRTDAIPQSAFEGQPLLPPQAAPQFGMCNIVAGGATPPEEGTAPGAGGDGGPGIIQMHVSDPAAQLLFPLRVGEVYGTNLDPTRSMSPPPLGFSAPTEPVDRMIPFFSARSEAFSQWVPIGLARVNPDGEADNMVEFLFDGTDTLTGNVMRDPVVTTTTDELGPIFAFAAVDLSGGAAPSVDSTTATVKIPGAGIDSVYTRNGALLRQFAVRLRAAGSMDEGAEYVVQSAVYDDAADEFTLIVDARPNDPTNSLVAVVNDLSGGAEVALVPFFFRFLSGGVEDLFPENTEVEIQFDATLADANGLPNEAAALGFTPNISDLNGPVGVNYEFVRFKVRFDLDTPGGNDGVDLSAPRPGLNYLRIPFRF